MREMHGMSKTKVYRAWWSNRHRMCKRWKDSFIAFFADVGTPEDSHRVFLCGPSKNMSKKNTHWSDRGLIEINGEWRGISDLAAEVGISREAMHKRVAIAKRDKQPIETIMRKKGVKV